MRSALTSCVEGFSTVLLLNDHCDVKVLKIVLFSIGF